ncbi:hypothetical protein [Macrococcus animalis]|uniref:hypothetical protein n=1 Tax=Macrococcus animalis TaxID=3395467 RepID=UPI0039BDA51D
MEYTLSFHAYERYKERVNKNMSKVSATRHVNQMIREGRYIGESEGHSFSFYEDYKIIFNDKSLTVITISYTNVYDNKEMNRELHTILVRRLTKEVKTLLKVYKTQQISYHEAMIRKLKAKNPNVIKSIETDIEESREYLKRTKIDIETITKTCKKYYISANEVGLDKYYGGS